MLVFAAAQQFDFAENTQLSICFHVAKMRHAKNAFLFLLQRT
jgi:hypothetical protein